MMFCILLMTVGLALMLATEPLGHHASGLFKIVASTGFIALGVAAGGFHSAYGLVMLAGLGFSWWGDFFLISRNRHIFLMGMAAFFLAHLAYCAAFLVQGVAPAGAVIGGALALPVSLGVARYLKPHLGDMRGPVLAYMAVITLMVALAAGTVADLRSLELLAAALLFYASDFFVARDRFVRPGFVNRLVGLPLYYAAQAWFAWTIASTQ